MNPILLNDILVEIGSHVNPGPDLLNLSLTSRWIHSNIYPLLFRDIELRDYNNSQKIVQHLLLNPQVARTVQSLVLRPSFLQLSSEELLAREQDLARNVERLAPNLYNLRKFVWDGIEIPASSLWASLKLGCPYLKQIGANLGNEKLDPDSELFSFSDLTSFSLTSELHYNIPTFLNENMIRYGEEFPLALWTMLIDRSPRLRTLALGDGGITMYTERLFSLCPILHARWPYLHTLSISGACVGDRLDFDSLNEKRFAAFIEAHHETLKHISFYQVHVQSGDRDPPLLEHKGRYGFKDLKLMPVVPMSLHEVVFTDRAFCGISMPELTRFLRSLRALRKLEVRLDFSELVPINAETEKLKLLYRLQIKDLKELVESCPSLESLKLFLSTSKDETIYWRDIPLILGQHQLKHLEVWKTPKSDDLGLKEAAIQIALAENSSNPENSHSPSSDISLSSPTEFATPRLETITLADCLWIGHRLADDKLIQVLFHGTYRIHRQTVSNEGDSDLPSVDETRSDKPSPSMSTGKNGYQATSQVETIPKQTIVTLMANERGGELGWPVRHYPIQLGALMGANKVMLKGKMIGEKFVAGQREWHMIEPNETVLRRTPFLLLELFGLSMMIICFICSLEVDNPWLAWDLIALAVVVVGFITVLFSGPQSLSRDIGRIVFQIGAMGVGLPPLWRSYKAS